MAGSSEVGRVLAGDDALSHSALEADHSRWRAVVPASRQEYWELVDIHWAEAVALGDHLEWDVAGSRSAMSEVVEDDSPGTDVLEAHAGLDLTSDEERSLVSEGSEDGTCP